MQILRLKDLAETPWKNGGGVTREIAMARQGDALIWRISRADVTQDGVFSDFAGLTRVLTVVSETGMALTHATGTLRADPWVPVRFDGAVRVHATLDAGPLTDLNLMYDPRRTRATVTTLQAQGTYAPAKAPRITILHALAGSPRIADTMLHPGDTALSVTGPLMLNEGDAALRIAIAPLDQTAASNPVIAAR